MPNLSISTTLSKLAAVMAAVIAFATSSSAQNVNFELTDSGVLNDTSHGSGIEMRIQPSEIPDGGLSGELMDEMLLPICNHFAPHVVPFILQQTDLTDPQFIAVRIVTGGSFGRYVLQLYELDGGKCGEKLN